MENKNTWKDRWTVTSRVFLTILCNSIGCSFVKVTKVGTRSGNSENNNQPRHCFVTWKYKFLCKNICKKYRGRLYKIDRRVCVCFFFFNWSHEKVIFEIRRIETRVGMRKLRVNNVSPELKQVGKPEKNNGKDRTLKESRNKRLTWKGHSQVVIIFRQSWDKWGLFKEFHPRPWSPFAKAMNRVVFHSRASSNSKPAKTLLPLLTFYFLPSQYILPLFFFIYYVERY